MIKPTFKTSDIRAFIAQKHERLEQAVISRFQRIGELTLVEFRTQTSWNDVTGNLRSSGGYIIMRNSQQLVQGGFETIKAGAQGSENGKFVIEQVAKKYPTGIILIFCVGMSYAIHLEAMGRSVLTNPALIAKQLVKDAMEKLKGKL